jgi:hypothetical protein
LFYGIIFSIDTEKEELDYDYYRPEPDGEWNKTEDHESEYDFFETGWHRKWCALLDQAGMDTFVAKFEFDSLDSTGGALGMPQPDGELHLGLCPAFAIETDDPDAEVRACVTPYIMQGKDDDAIPELRLPEREDDAKLEEEDWKIIQEWFRKKYKLR